MSLSHTIANAIVKEKCTKEDLFALLEKYKLQSLFPSILKSLKQLSAMKALGETLVIETPFEMDIKALRAIKNKLGATAASEKVVINRNLLAGFKARYKGNLYDGSADRLIRQLLAEKRT